MDIVTERLRDLWHGTAKRYRDNTETRKRRKDALESGRDWRGVDDPQRIRTRLQRKGMTSSFSEALIDEAAPDSGLAMVLLERIIAESQLLDANFLLIGVRSMRSVGRVVIRSSSGRLLGHGTGFLVSPRLMMTNNHVLASHAEAASSAIQFDYLQSLDGSPINVVEFGLDPDSFFATNAALDFTLVAVAGTSDTGSPIGSRGWKPLIRESGKAIVGERVNIIQHPRGETMQIAIRDNTLEDVLDDHLHYLADTQQGSSGSAVCNDAWEIAALHHSGVPATDDAGNILLNDGSVWDRRQSTMHLIKWVANEGIRISRIVAHLDALPMTADKRALYDAAFLPPVLTEALGAGAPAVIDGGGGPGWAHATEADGSSSWYFRLNFGPVGASPPAPKPVPPPTKSPSGSTGTDRPTDGIEDLARATARGLIADAGLDRPYYDCARDKEARDAYYQDVDLGGSPDELFDALSTLVDKTHTGRFSYRTARLKFLYPLVDLRESGDLRNIYSGTVLPAEEVIADELMRLESARPGFLAEMDRVGFAEAFEAEGEEAWEIELEAQLPFNCEHVVPQSWFDKRQPMRSDLHHLFACEPTCNSFRGNIPYFDFEPLLEADLTEAEMTNCGRREGDKFEPVFNHGVVARATLYFLLRYPDEVGDTVKELKTDRLETLLRWHETEPVRLYEKHRNAAIGESQGNRNPLIDFPDLSRKIAFAKGFA
jgi:endonuclease I/V8-like Glu-specific endopeptidase